MLFAHCVSLSNKWKKNTKCVPFVVALFAHRKQKTENDKSNERQTNVCCMAALCKTKSYMNKFFNYIVCDKKNALAPPLRTSNVRSWSRHIGRDVLFRKNNNNNNWITLCISDFSLSIFPFLFRFFFRFASSRRHFDDYLFVGRCVRVCVCDQGKKSLWRRTTEQKKKKRDRPATTLTCRRAWRQCAIAHLCMRVALSVNHCRAFEQFFFASRTFAPCDGHIHIC